MIQELEVKSSDFYLAMGHVIGYRVGEYREGKKKYYYLLDMVYRYQEILKRTGNRKIPIKSNE